MIFKLTIVPGFLIYFYVFLENKSVRKCVFMYHLKTVYIFLRSKKALSWMMLILVGHFFRILFFQNFLFMWAKKRNFVAKFEDFGPKFSIICKS